ncbi:MAG: hypothetical protein GPJ54_16485 [Candidatus Heimdallarchaeota archaeon]|nr:hypothetical protein [Candidatus Heimdallarchaeota archaeon]
MHQTTYQIESTSFFSLEKANQYLFTKLTLRLQYPTSKFDVVNLVLTLIDDTTLEYTIPLRYRDELFDFLHNLYYSHGVNIITYYGMMSLQDKFHQAMISGISPFSFTLIRDIETRVQGMATN